MIYLLAQVQQNWIDQVLQKWIASSDESYLFLTLSIVVILGLSSALIFLFFLLLKRIDVYNKTVLELINKQFIAGNQFAEALEENNRVIDKLIEKTCQSERKRKEVEIIGDSNKENIYRPEENKETNG